jgi:LysM repeat protein
MNIPFRKPKKKKLQAATAQRAREADFTDEPNVKWSSAFVVVLLLHVVAVGAICAFNEIKTHQAPAFDEADAPVAAPAPTAAAPQIAESQPAEAAPAPAPAKPVTYVVKSGDTIAKIAAAYGVSPAAVIDLNNLIQTHGIHVGQDLTLPAGAANPAALKDSGGTYTVMHGDTPMSIARKLHVGYDDLMRLNKIEDAKKLRVGMKLKVPAKHATA